MNVPGLSEEMSSSQAWYPHLKVRATFLIQKPPLHESVRQTGLRRRISLAIRRRISLASHDRDSSAENFDRRRIERL